MSAMTRDEVLKLAMDADAFIEYTGDDVIDALTFTPYQLESFARAVAARELKRQLERSAPIEPEGWRTGVHEDSSQVWLTLRGPEGQQAAFAVPNVGIRAEILRGYRAALTKEIGHE